MTTTLSEPREPKQGEKVRVLGTIIMDPETKVSGKGNEYTKLVIATSNGMGKGADIIWNGTVMQKLRSKLPEELFRKFAYAKFIGIGSHKDYVSKAGKAGTSNDLLVNAVELQDGTIVYQDEKKGRDEDAPF